ncbi:hypothetical protein SY1_24120 [Fretibacterium fastidiosum]|uniref:Uncharacterized protein n=1 Tax=Fretibacterium fastidiosum TaxID=651822 RepID=A0AB94IZ41_9BACT|nr:hypothetical protein SY1_24120 [Fretibacterium fastidiosum]
MVSHNQRDIVKSPDAQQFTFSTSITNHALFAHFVTFLNLYVFLCRNAEKGYITTKASANIRCTESNSGAKHTGELSVVTATVCGSGLWIGSGRGRYRQCVKFSHQTDSWPVKKTMKVAFNTCDGQVLLRLQSQRPHFFCKLARRPMFLKAQFSMAPEVISKRNKFIAMAIDNLTNPFFYFFHVYPS